MVLSSSFRSFLVSFWSHGIGTSLHGICENSVSNRSFFPCFHWKSMSKIWSSLEKIMIPPFFRHWNENSNSLGNYTPIFGVYIPQYMGHFVTLCFCDLKNIFSLWECVRIPLVCLKFSTIHISSSNLLLSLLNIIQHVNKICECTIPLPENG